MYAEAVVMSGNRRDVKRSAPWILLATLASFAAVAILFSRHVMRDRSASLAELITASSTGARTVEARLSGGFRWAPFRRSATGDVTLADAIGMAWSGSRGSPTAITQHKLGIAQLLAGHHRQALSELSAAAESSRDARTWSDLAAAYCEASTRFDAPELLADALTAADMSLGLNSELAEALFNRALILQHLGLREDARDAWNLYLLRDSDPAWQMEARERLREVAPAGTFREALDQARRRRQGDAAVARELVLRDREDARIQGIVEILGRWADAETRHDRTAAGLELSLAREIAAQIRASNGDQMFARTVAAIDASRDDARAALAAAHLDYSHAFRAFEGNRAAEAQPLARRAADALARAGSPLALMARYLVANTIFDAGRREEARNLLEGVLADTTPDLPACRAHVLSQIGACHFARAAWGESLASLEKSAAIFESLGETGNASAVKRLISIIYDQNGDRERAWTWRMASLRGLGRQSNLRLEKVVSSMAQDAMTRGKWRTALSFLNVEIAVARRFGDDVHLAETLFFRATARHHLGDRRGAQDDVAEGRAVVARVKDATYLPYLRIHELEVRATLTPSTPDAIQMLGEALDFEGSREDRRDLPRLLLQRARARRAVGDLAGASSDLEKGIAELETERGSLAKGEARWGAFHSADELFEEAIDLAVDRDVARAFAIAERARARSLLEASGPPRAFDPRRLSAGTVLVEYASLPSRLVIFVSTQSGTEAVTIACDRECIARTASAMIGALQSGASEQARRASQAAWAQLIEPIATRVADATTLVFVTDGATSGLPFGALLDPRGQFLVENHAVVVSPGAAFFLEAASRHSGASTRRSALIVANPQPGAEGGALTSVPREAEGVARSYASSVRLADDDEQYDELMRRSSLADVIHFAGHAVGDDTGLEPASLLLREKGAERRVAVAAIAALPVRRTSVVVLAGCNTARGERRGAEGVISTARGFLTAGAPSVIATLWSIDDAGSAVIFPRLHALLAQGHPPAEALRAVQIESIRRGDVPMSLWAALQLIGS